MKILPPENPRRLTGTVQHNDAPPDVGPGEATRHYHYHASGDAEERIRRDALRDFLHEQAKERAAHRRAVALTIFGLVIAAGGLGVFLTPWISTPASDSSSGSNAVQVTSELRDGKWVATAKRVTVPGSREADQSKNEAPSEDTQTVDDIVVNDDTADSTSTALRMCQGEWASPDGVLASVDGSKATMWFEYQVREGNMMGQTLVGEPVGVGLSFSGNNGLPGLVFTCESDHMLITRLNDNTSVLLAPSNDEEFANTLRAWRNGS
jgi:hypothetical protein